MCFFWVFLPSLPVRHDSFLCLMHNKGHSHCQGFEGACWHHQAGSALIAASRVTHQLSGIVAHNATRRISRLSHCCYCMMRVSSASWMNILPNSRTAVKTTTSLYAQSQTKQNRVATLVFSHQASFHCIFPSYISSSFLPNTLLFFSIPNLLWRY